MVIHGSSGTVWLSLAVNAGAVVDGTGNAHLDMRTSAAVAIDPNASFGQPVCLLLAKIVVVPDRAEFIAIVTSAREAVEPEARRLTRNRSAPAARVGRRPAATR